MNYDHNNVSLARKLRKNMTPWEQKLWFRFLRVYPIRFQRQKTIGPYIVDFFCSKAGLIIELDGSGHYTPAQQNKDAARERWLEENGYMIIRFPNIEVDQYFYEVCTVIDRKVQERLPKKE